MQLILKLLCTKKKSIENQNIFLVSPYLFPQTQTIMCNFKSWSMHIAFPVTACASIGTKSSDAFVIFVNHRVVVIIYLHSLN